MGFMRNAYLCIVNMTIQRVNADYFPLLEHGDAPESRRMSL